MHNLTLDNCTIQYQVFFKNIKHMYLRVQQNTVFVTANKRFSRPVIEAFIKKHQRWVLKQLSLKKIHIYNLEQMLLWGRLYPVNIRHRPSTNCFEKMAFYLTNTKPSDIEQIYHQAVLSEVQSILNQERQLLEKYLDVSGITFKSQLMRSRLGSCHYKKRIIKLNTILGRVDKRYIKLVLFHELAHLKYQDHSKQFHNLLENLYPNHRLHQRTLSRLIKGFDQSSQSMKT